MMKVVLSLIMRKDAVGYDKLQVIFFKKQTKITMLTTVLQMALLKITEKVASATKDLLLTQ